MKAYTLRAVGELVLEERPLPDTPAGWALVRVKAAGICSSDIGRIFTKGTYHFPTVPGHEFSGVVERVGDAADAAWVGRRVSVFPLIPCRACDQCAAGHYEMCRDYDYIGSRRDGAFAEYVTAPVWNLQPLPDGVSFEAGALNEPLAVALHAVDTLAVRPGDRCAVVGAGMIGLAAAMIVKARGGDAAVLGRSADKAALVARAGVPYLTGDRAEGPFDRVLEAVGTPEAVARAIRVAAPGGVVTLMGNPVSDIALSQADYWQILRRQLTLKGTWNSRYEQGAPSDWTEVLKMLSLGQIDAGALISHVFPFDALPEALELMRRRKQAYLKVIIQ